MRTVVSMMLALYLAALVSGAGNNGVIQIPVSGEYCSNWYSGSSFEYKLYYDDSCQNCDEVCTSCFGGEHQECPWNCYDGCLGEYYSFVYDYEIYDAVCKAGCVSSANCTAIANAYFTGSGTAIGNPNSCPFECNAGYTKSGSSCVAAAFHAP